MTAHRLTSYLKTYRKRSGLTQNEVAFLLGWKRGEQLSRYEKRHAMPSLDVALACAAIFRVSLRKLFPGVSDPIVREISSRIVALTAELRKKNSQGKDTRLTARKLSWLRENHGRP
jgi:transcriptional regulator with XRE-family HTH domain